MWRFFCNKLIILSMTGFAIISCGNADVVTANRCVLIDLHQKEGLKLVPMLDKFAKENGLIPDKSHPIAPSYKLQNDNEDIAEIVLTIGLGKFGAELAMFQFDNALSNSLTERFDELINGDMADSYAVKRCENVKGYSLPILVCTTMINI